MRSMINNNKPELKTDKEKAKENFQMNNFNNPYGLNQMVTRFPQNNAGLFFSKKNYFNNGQI